MEGNESFVIRRVHTGIPGLDELVDGGFPENTVNLVAGPTGSAKTLFGMQFIYNGAVEYNDVGIYVTLEERKENIQRGMWSFGMDVNRAEKERKMILVDVSKIRAKLHSDSDMTRGIVGFAKLQNFLERFLSATQAKRFVLDSITAAGMSYKENELMRQELFAFSSFLQEQDITSLLITESTNETGDQTRYGVEQFVADSFINLGLERLSGELRRSITIRKMRFTRHDTKVHPLLITKKGIIVESEAEVF
ncbi:MAG: ATPase [Thermoplasmata archaeon]|nr:MAG: ATPase [Thermoplasmata archaeon]